MLSKKASIKRFKERASKKSDQEEITQKLLQGDISVLSKCITLVESSRNESKKKAQEIIEKCLPHTGKSIRLGITGVPGVGKSTFIESFGSYLTQKGHKVAVLAVDPSSTLSKGSILGDKTRMSKLSIDKNAFIRPSPSSGALGGVTNATGESILLCEAAGFDVIIIETVGVGQSETEVYNMVDFFLLLMLAGAGDELQGIKRGIMEMADVVIINKADGENLKLAKSARREYQNALHLFPLKDSKLPPKVQICSALENKKIDEVWKTVTDFTSKTKQSGYFEQKRRSQAVSSLHQSIRYFIGQNLKENPVLARTLKTKEKEVTRGETTPYKAAETIVKMLLK